MSDRLSMIEYLSAVHDHGINAWEALLDLGYHPKVIYAKAEKASRRGYTDYGVSPRRSWLTDGGCSAVLAALSNDHSTVATEASPSVTLDGEGSEGQ